MFVGHLGAGPALDFVVHVDDLPLMTRESARVGLGLWNDMPVALAFVVDGRFGLLSATARDTSTVLNSVST